jgi:uncharacterized repeat protein (TIGR01451 family)
MTKVILKFAKSGLGIILGATLTLTGLAIPAVIIRASGVPNLELEMTATNNTHPDYDGGDFLSHESNFAVPGDVVTYNFFLGNSGSEDATNVVVMDQIPQVGGTRYGFYRVDSATTGVAEITAQVSRDNGATWQDPSAGTRGAPDPSVTNVKFMLAELPAGTTGDDVVQFTFELKMGDLSTDSQVSLSNVAQVTSTEVASPVNSNTVTTKLSNRPEFNFVVPGERANTLTGTTVITQPGPWGDNTPANPGQEVGLRVYVNNGVWGTTARNTRVKLIFPSEASTVQTVTAEVWADNADKITDTTVFTLPVSAKLRYLLNSEKANGSCKLTDPTRQFVLCSDEIATSGTNVGDVGGPGQTLQLTVEAVFEQPSPTPTPTPTMTPTPSPTPTPCVSCGQSQTQTQTQENNQNVTVNVTQNPQVQGAVAPKELPKTGASALALASLFGGVPAGFGLRAFGIRVGNRATQEKLPTPGESVAWIGILEERKKAKSDPA